jgi:hypothetical protein
MTGSSPEAEIALALAEDTRQGRVKWRNGFAESGPISPVFTHARWRGMRVEIGWRSGYKSGEPMHQCSRLVIGGLDCGRYGNPVVAEVVGEEKTRKRAREQSIIRRVYRKVFGRELGA